MMSALTEVSHQMADVVAAAGALVARVEGRRRFPASGVIWSTDGLVVTANHVVKRDDQIGVGLADGSHVAATLVGRDPSTDLALLKIDATDLAAATWVDAADLRVGHLALALGRPGETVQATLGIVSALGGPWRTAVGGKVDSYVQTDVLMYPGFSGGPLVAADGRVAGLNTSALTRGTSIALPAATLQRVVAELAQHGRVKRGYLGVGLQPVRLAAGIQEALQQETGVMLLSVEDDGPAAAAGLVQGDIVVALDGRPVRHIDGLQALLTGDRVGQRVPVSVVRGGAVTELQIVIGER